MADIFIPITFFVFITYNMARGIFTPINRVHPI